MNLFSQETQVFFNHTSRRTESFLDSRSRLAVNSSRQPRAFSFNTHKRLYQTSSKPAHSDLNSTKDSTTPINKRPATGSMTTKVSRPLTANNSNNQKISGKSMEKFRLTQNMPEEQKQTIFGPVVKKLHIPVTIKGTNIINKIHEPQSTDRNSSINSYIIGRDIGKGAYAVVKLAIHKGTGQKFAVKIYDKSKFAETSRMKNAYREIQILQALSHPHIIKLYETHETPEALYLILEYIQGCSLNEYVKKHSERRLSDQEACRIFFQLTSALLYCHSQAIAHRDIKFDNVLLDCNNNVKLIDFGFSTNTQTPSRVFCGTPSYMAPEIIQKVEYLGPPVDIWACGVVLFGMICGYFPFKSQSDKECYKKILNGIVYIPNFVSKGPRDLLEKTLKVNPDQRIAIKELIECGWFKEMGMKNETRLEEPKIKTDPVIEQLVKHI